MFNKKDIKRDEFMLVGKQARCGYDWYWHSFTAINEKTKEEKPFFFEFYMCNPSLGKYEPIYGQLKSNIDNNVKPSYLMIKVGTWGDNHKQLHRFFGWNNIEVNVNASFSIKADDCFLSENESYGCVSLSEDDAFNHPEYMSDAGTIKWNLKINKIIPFNVGYGASKLFRSLQLFEMFWHAEGMKTVYSGEVFLDGERYIVDPSTCYGYADKNWGKDFTSPWVWLSSNNLVSKITGEKLNNSVFDIGGGCPKIGHFALKRKLLSAFYYEGKCFEFNFSKFWTNTKTKFSFKEYDKKVYWHVEQTTWHNKMITDICCDKKDMIFINYESPKGEKKHNHLWNGGNGYGNVKLYHNNILVDDINVFNVGCEYGEFDK